MSRKLIARTVEAAKASYRVHVVQEMDDTLSATIPALPEVAISGKDMRAIRRNAGNAIDKAIAARIRAGKPVPRGDGHSMPRKAKPTSAPKAPAASRKKGSEPKRAKPLTTVAVRNLRPRPPERYEKPDAGCKGLYVVVQPSGAKSFAFRYHNAAGKAPKLTLGPWHDGPELDAKPVIDGPLTLAGARLLAAEALHQVKQGRDPAAEKKAAKQATKQT